MNNNFISFLYLYIFIYINIMENMTMKNSKLTSVKILKILYHRFKLSNSKYKNDITKT